MPETAALKLVDADGRPESWQRRDVVALVWAMDEGQAVKAVENLRRGLWAYWYLFRIGEVQQRFLGECCPLRRDDPAVLASVAGERWMWVLVTPGTDLEAVAACT